MWPAMAEVSQIMAGICTAETRPSLTGLKLQEPPRFTAQLLRDAGSWFMHIALLAIIYLRWVALNSRRSGLSQAREFITKDNNTCDSRVLVTGNLE